MDDERIERALRQGPPDEPIYVPRGERARTPRQRSFGFRRLWGFAQIGATLAIIIALVAGIVVLRGGRLPGIAATPAPTTAPSLLDAVRARGVLRVGVAPTYPQVQIAGGVYDGFDISLARAIAAQMGVQIEITIVAEGDLEQGGWAGRWDVAVGVPAIPQRSLRLRFSQPYAYWPALVVVPDGSTAASPADLAGGKGCAAEGSVALAWVQGRLDAAALIRPVTPPSGAIISTQATEAACLDATDADFTITERSIPATLSTRAGVHALTSPAFIEPVGAAVDVAGPDPESFVGEFDRALNALRTDGTLATLSLQQLGGTDLTAKP